MPKNRKAAKLTYCLKLGIFPAKENTRIIEGQSKICNWLYNQLLENANTLKSEWKTTGDNTKALIVYSERGLRNLLPAIKAKNPFLKSVHSSPLKNTALRLSKSIRAYQDSRKGKRNGKVVGWPKFKSFKRKFFSLEYDEKYKGYGVTDGTLKLSFGLGDQRKQHHILIAMPDSCLLKNKIVKALRVTRENGSYFAIFTIVKEAVEKKATQNVIALDPNHKNLAYGVDSKSNAIEIEAPHWLKKFDKRFDELKSKRDKCKKQSRLVEVKNEQGEVVRKYWQQSRRYQRYQRTIERAQAKRREQTKTFRFTVANALCRRYDLIGVGDYTPHGGGLNTKMRRAMNNRSIIGTFKDALSWCAEKSGKRAVKWNETGSTRECHACKKVVEGGLKPSIREWQCEKCAMHHHRDENSAIHGLRRMSEKERSPSILGSVPGSGPVFIKKRWAWRVLPSGVLVTLRGESGYSNSSRQEIIRKELGDFHPK
jgi:putative transposase